MRNYFLLRFLTILSFGIVIYYFLVHAISMEIGIYFRPEKSISGIFNADQLSLVYLYQDLLMHHGSLHAWSFSPVPYFFPDGFVFFLLAFISKNLIVSTLLSNAILLIAYAIGLIQLGVLLCGSQSKRLFQLSALISLVAASGSLSSQEIFVPLWTSHFGSTVIIYLWSLLLLCQIIRQQYRDYRILILFILIFLTSFSDPYFSILFVGSIFFGFLLLWHKNVPCQFLCFCFGNIFLAAALGFLCNGFDIFHVGIHSLFASDMFLKIYALHAPAAIITLFHIFSLFFYQHFILFLITIGMFLYSLTFFFKTQITLAEFVIISITSTLLITLIMGIFFDIDCLKPHFLGLRHFQTTLILIPFLCLPMLLTKSPWITRTAHRYYGYFLILTIFYLLFFRTYEPISAMIHFYPPITACIDQKIKSGELKEKNGIANYWDTHNNSFLSKEGLHLVAVNEHLKPYDWLSTKEDYMNETFYFALLQPSSYLEKQVRFQWGTPEKILTCGHTNTSYVIYIYPQGHQIK